LDTALGLFGVVLWIATTIGIAAGITFLVVKVFPGDEDLKPKSEPQA
jgi:hypothetical protein